MRTSVKTPLIILSALALLAGCKSERPVTGPRAGYLHSEDGAVTFIEWARTGQKLEGQISALERRFNGNLRVTKYLFHGTLNAEKVSLTLNSSGNPKDGFHVMDKTITGTLK